MEWDGFRGGDPILVHVFFGGGGCFHVFFVVFRFQHRCQDFKWDNPAGRDFQLNGADTCPICNYEVNITWTVAWLNMAKKFGNEQWEAPQGSWWPWWLGMDWMDWGRQKNCSWDIIDWKYIIMGIKIKQPGFHGMKEGHQHCSFVGVSSFLCSQIRKTQWVWGMAYQTVHLP